MTSARYVLNRNAVTKKLMAAFSVNVTNKLIAYAENKIQKIGDEIKSYSGGNNMQRTMNLLDSLCWGVSFKGELKGYGYYQPQQASELSYLHELSGDYADYPVGGHVLAEKFVKQMGNLKYDGWRVFFAVLAPYWGYWEKGFRFNTKNSSYQEDDAVSYRFLKWAVMAQNVDSISGELKPAVVKYSVNVDTSKKWKPSVDKGNGNPRYNKYGNRGYRDLMNNENPFVKYNRKKRLR